MSSSDPTQLERFHLAAIVDSSDDAIFSHDLEGVVRSWNRGAERLFGFTSDEIRGRSVFLLVPESGRAQEERILARVRSGERIEHYETLRRRKDGTPVEVSVAVSPVRDDGGRIIGASKVVRDVGPRRRAEEAASHLAAIVASSDDAIVGKSLQGVIRSWNAGAERLFGYTEQEVIGRSITILIPTDRLHEEDEILDRIRRGQRVEHFETVRIRKDGRQIDVAVTISPVKDASGRIIGASKIARDVSEQKRAEKEREQLLAREQQARAEADAANRAKDEFLATLSHELRTPLNAIVGWTEVLRAARHDPQTTARALDTITRNAQHQAHLIDDLLDLSSIVSGRFRLNPRPVDLVAVVTAALETVRPAADAKRLRVETRFDSTAGAVSGDPDRLQQVFWNLLANAVKFTSTGGWVAIRLARVGSRAVVEVSDNGIGIAPELLPAVFDRFRQADSSITRVHGGLGLGLAIVRQLVELHGGTVRAESAGEGQGSTFTVSLPVLSVRGPEPRAPGASAELVRCDGISVFLVDDDPDGRELIAVLLTQCGAVVRAVGSAREALAALQEETPDIIVSDLAMPEVDGYELIRRVRALPAGRSVPAVALTAHAGPEARARAFLAGFDTYVVKPVSPGELVAVIVRLVGRAGAAGV